MDLWLHIYQTGGLVPSWKLGEKFQTLAIVWLSINRPVETIYTQYHGVAKLISGRGFDPETDIGDISGKVIAITGGNGGTGKEIVLQLAKHSPEHIYLLARSDRKTSAAISEIQSIVPSARLTHISCDLASFASVSQAASILRSHTSLIHVLINHAGVMAELPGITKDGYEIQFGTNHIGHHLLTKLLLPVLESTPQSRIIAVSSIAHEIAPPAGIVFDMLKTDGESYGTWIRYGQTKLANILFTKELARCHPKISAVALHPGLINSGLFDANERVNPWCSWMVKLGGPIFMATVAQGAKNTLWAATTDTDTFQSGGYYSPIGRMTIGSKNANNCALAEELWEWTENELKENGYQ